jgi:hypothetical protein
LLLVQHSVARKGKKVSDHEVGEADVADVADVVDVEAEGVTGVVGIAKVGTTIRLSHQLELLTMNQRE